MRSSSLSYSKLLYIVVFFVSLCCSFSGSAQTAVAGTKELLRPYPKMRSLISKKTKKKNAVHLLQVQWMDTTFQLERKYANFIKGVPVPKEDNSYYSIYREEPWNGGGYVLPHANCHNFGVAQAFRHEGMDATELFSPTTYLDPSMLEVLLLSSFQKAGSLDATSMRDLNQPIPTGTLLVFRDSSGVALHTAFQSEEGLLSKNGRYEPRIYHQLRYLKMVYYQALTIDLYRMDTPEVKAYLEEQPMQALLQK